MNWKLWGTAIITVLLAGMFFVHQTNYGGGLLRFSELFQLAANTVTVLGIPIAILVYLDEMKKDRKEREYGTFHALDDQDAASTCDLRSPFRYSHGTLCGGLPNHRQRLGIASLGEPGPAAVRWDSSSVRTRSAITCRRASAALLKIGR